MYKIYIFFYAFFVLLLAYVLKILSYIHREYKNSTILTL